MTASLSIFNQARKDARLKCMCLNYIFEDDHCYSPIYTELLAFQGLCKVGLVGGIVGTSETRLIFPLLGRETDAVGECHRH